MPNISRDMIVIIQGLVILFAGAFEHMFRCHEVQRIYTPNGSSPDGYGKCIMSVYDTLLVLFDSTIRLSIPLIFAALAGLYSERSGIVDIGLEGKMLVAAFAAGAAAAVYDSAIIGLLAGLLAAIFLSLVHGFASITHRGDQIVSGVAINFIAAGSTVILGQAWISTRGTTGLPSLSADGRFGPIDLPFAEALSGVPILGPFYADVISGHAVLVYFAFAMVPSSHGGFYFARALVCG